MGRGHEVGQSSIHSLKSLLCISETDDGADCMQSEEMMLTLGKAK